MKKTVLVLFGGCSSEYPVSLQSAAAILRHMDSEKYRPLPVGITREGRWLYYQGPLSCIETDDWHRHTACTPCTLSLDRGKGQLLMLDSSGQRLSFDAAFPVLHGQNGEDGTVQGLLELAGVPLIGCGTLSSALCMDKDRAHTLVAAAGIKIPASQVFCRKASAQSIRCGAQRLGYPLFVKPVRAGSSFGITQVKRPEDLMEAVEKAFAYDREVIVEERVPGFEVGCAVLGSGELTVGLVDEIELSAGFFDYEEKYALKSSKIHCPARISQEKTAEIQAVAKTIYRVLDCRVFARVDLFVTPSGDVVFNEVNTIPGFTAHSRYPSMMRGIGLDFGDLIDRLIQEGVRV